jgi:hypothetical protein
VKPYLIKLWHGIVPNESLFFSKIEELCRLNHGNLYWDGTLDEFATKWKDKFIFLPATGTDAEYIEGRICVTPYGGFGQR